MAVVSATRGLSLKSDWDARQRDKALARKDVVDDLELLSPEKQKEFEIMRYCSKLFDDGQKARRPHETFDTAWSMYNSDMWRENRPGWRATITINKVRAFITFIQAIMTDNKPRIAVEPSVPGSEDAADLLRKLVDRDWDDDNDMQSIISTLVLWGLIWGYAFLKVWYDPYGNNGRGKHMVAVIPPNRIYTNRTATCIEDAQYIIHSEPKSMGWIREEFPTKAMAVSKVRGIPNRDQQDHTRDRDFVREGQATGATVLSAMQVNQNIITPQLPVSHSQFFDDDQDEVEVTEYWFKDESLEPYERQQVKNGQGVFEPAVENGEVMMQVVGTKTIINELTGQPQSVPKRTPKMKPVMETAWRKKYPNGRLAVVAAGLVLLRDIPNPGQTDGFPFAMWKDYDVGDFHGQGEPLTLRSCAFAINKLASQVFEILEKTGNPSWKLKMGVGVHQNQIKNKPGLVIPMEDITGLAPLDKPPIPKEFFELYKLISDGMAEVSGVNDAIRGAMPKGDTAFATVDQLTEAGSAPIRLKVRNLERCLKRYGQLRIQLIQQHDQGARPLRVATEDLAPGVVQPAGDVSVQFRRYKNADLQGQVEFKIVPISSLSTSPAGTWNKWMSLIEKKLIDVPWWHSKFRIEGWKTELPRMLAQQKKDAADEAKLKAASKGPAPKSQSRQAAQNRRAPASSIPSREENSRMR